MVVWAAANITGLDLSCVPPMPSAAALTKAALVQVAVWSAKSSLDETGLISRADMDEDEGEYRRPRSRAEVRCMRLALSSCLPSTRANAPYWLHQLDSCACTMAGCSRKPMNCAGWVAWWLCSGAVPSWCTQQGILAHVQPCLAISHFMLCPSWRPTPARMPQASAQPACSARSLHAWKQACMHACLPRHGATSTSLPRSRALLAPCINVNVLYCDVT